MILKDWSTYPAGKEKYHLYLASREWALLKEQVRSRSQGWCERCFVGEASQVHHQTYERMYREALSDLVHLCRRCHEFLSGKSHDDPANEKLPPWIWSYVRIGDRVTHPEYGMGAIDAAENPENPKVRILFDKVGHKTFWLFKSPLRPISIIRGSTS